MTIEILTVLPELLTSPFEHSKKDSLPLNYIHSGSGPSINMDR
jgi:hypothetical protein